MARNIQSKCSPPADRFSLTSYQVLRLTLNTYTFFLLGLEAGRLHMILEKKLCFKWCRCEEILESITFSYNILGQVKNTFYVNENKLNSKLFKLEQLWIPLFNFFVYLLLPFAILCLLFFISTYTTAVTEVKFQTSNLAATVTQTERWIGLTLVSSDHDHCDLRPLPVLWIFSI